MPAGTLIALVNGDEQISLNLAGDTDAKPTRGYHLVTYQANPAPAELARNSSLYIDGNTPVYSKAGNTVETIVINIKGTDAPDAYDYLRALQRWAYWVRDYHAAPNSRWPSYMSYSPWGVSGRYYAVLINAQVNESDQSGRADADKGWIKRVTITIERESFWRQQPPTNAAFGTSYSFVSGGNTSAYQAPRWWGVLPFNGLAGGLAVPAGDVPALVKLGVTPNSGFNLSRAVFGYVSQKRTAPPGYTIPTTPTVHEAENFVIDDPTHVFRQFVSAASPNTGGPTVDNTVRVQTHTTYALRIHASIGLGLQSCRIFARMRVIPFGVATTVSVRMTQQAAAVATFTGPAVTVDSAVTEWAMYDMGVFTPPIEVAPEWSSTIASFTLGVGVYTQHLTGTENLEIDCFVLIPCDEYYLDMSCVPQTTDQTKPAMIANNIMVPNTTTGNVNGTLYIPPGKGVLYYLAGWDNFQNSWDPISTPTSPVEFNLFYSERYGSIKGN